MSGLVVTTAPTGETLTEAEIRNYLRVDDVNELAMLQLLRVGCLLNFLWQDINLHYESS